ncbi:MAG TPA: orotidine-5'-phosphate decarboxylase [Acidimicrobiales bacterium]|jgi:orotidine-5'-phosphate decarboxylase|nr:orotidine-5'-phosphate decarboxylase [Acidimicrobiales bacterium]
MAEEQGSGTATAGEVPPALRARLVLALDADDLVAARRLARQLHPYFGTMKVGLELYSAAGPEAISLLADLGVDVFCDIKLHDIPNTVGRAARVFGALGARYLTLHTAGGVSMLRAGVEGLREGAAGADLPEPVALGVTVLTSEPEASAHLLQQRVAAGLNGGCDGFVCAVPDVDTVRQIAPAAMLATPGIRPEGAAIDDQGRVATPRQALDAGADLLVVGRPVTRAPDPVAAAQALVAPLV